MRSPPRPAVVALAVAALLSAMPDRPSRADDALPAPKKTSDPTEPAAPTATSALAPTPTAAPPLAPTTPPTLTPNPQKPKPLGAPPDGTQNFDWPMKGPTDAATSGPAPTPGPDGVITFPGLRVDTRRGFLEVDGRICLQRGLIEVFACTSYGKVHEAVVVVDCRPEHLHAGLLLLGMVEERGQVKVLGDAGALKGDRAVITVAWRDDGGEVVKRAEELLLDETTGATMELCGFVFTGSRFIKVGKHETFASNATGQVITTFHDPDAILDNPLAKGSDDTVYYANSKVLPRAATRMTMRIVPGALTPAMTVVPVLKAELPSQHAPTAATPTAEPEKR